MILQDSSGRTITSFRVSLTDRCNLRCRYCMPENGIQFIEHAEILRYEEIERLIQLALQLGIRKVRLTGGEPLVRKGVLECIKRVRQFSALQTLTLTTNGILLAEYAEELCKAGISYLNVSLDTLNPETFYYLTRFYQLERVLHGIQTAKNAGFELIKVNVVSMRGVNDHELFDFVRFADEYDVEIRFIEYMPFSGNGWQQAQFISSQELKVRMTEQYSLIPRYETPSAAAVRTYHILGHKGSVGFISAVSNSFCQFCNRLRLTSDGCLRPCLHGPVEIDVKGPMRRGASDNDLLALFREAVDKKPRSHQSFLQHDHAYVECDREMVRIGG